MSGICGIFALDGMPVNEADIRAMTRVLERRGPDGTHVWVKGNVALGHTLLATTPEAQSETLPFIHQGTGCTISADVRLDNRDELLAFLGLAKNERIIGDGEIVLLAYLKWGTTCSDYLLGDFAFAIWDPRKQSFFCARDHMGMRRLNFFHIPGKIFIIATEPESIVKHPFVSNRINVTRICDYLEDMEGFDLSSTFYQNVFRLPPGHNIILNANAIKVQTYWRLQSQPDLKLKSDGEYEEAFLDVLRSAVSCRLRTNGPTATLLSGGIDSATIAAIAADLLARDGKDALQTFSAVGPGPGGCPETRNILALSQYPGTQSHHIAYSNLGENREFLRRGIEKADEPFDGHMDLPRAAYCIASKQSQLKVVLDGVPADNVLTTGNFVAELLGRGRIIEAVREAQANRFYFTGSMSGWEISFCYAMRRAWVPAPIRQVLSLGRTLYRSISPSESLVRSDIAKQVDLEARRRHAHEHFTRTSTSLSEQRLNIMRHPHGVAARERYDRVASAFGLEPRAPFLDKRVVEFCLSLPSSQLQREGWPKHILRRSMGQTLPHEVVWKQGRHHLGGAFTQALIPMEHIADARISDMRRTLSPYVASAHLDTLSPAQANPLAIAKHISLCYLYYWLSRFDK